MDFLNYTPELRDTPTVQAALKKLIAAYPDKEVNDRETKEAQVQMIAKLAEYKPLAKIEEIEEQNYNMIDDRLNNGVKKFNREEEKKEQAEKPQARTSLKERLTAKQHERSRSFSKTGQRGLGKKQRQMENCAIYFAKTEEKLTLF